MSRSDNTDPRERRARWQAKGGWRHWPIPSPHGRDLRRAWWKRHRQEERQGDPEPDRPRHSVRRDYW